MAEVGRRGRQVGGIHAWAFQRHFMVLLRRRLVLCLDLWRQVMLRLRRALLVLLLLLHLHLLLVLQDAGSLTLLLDPLQACLAWTTAGSLFVIARGSRVERFIGQRYRRHWWSGRLEG